MRHAGAAAVAVAEAEEADQRVARFEPTQPAGQRQLVVDIEGDLAEQRIVAVDAVLLGQPDRAGMAVDRQRRIEIGDLVILFDQVGLALVECARDQPDPVLAGCRDAEFLAQLGEMVLAENMLRRIDEIAVRIRSPTHKSHPDFG
ncbi:MAG: hypothetical protein ABS87_03815 [Sphingomonas sp. SCN 67-18]|nr:MAG: hypothetical protein ABS87_03815 [Sphingomonas sp. SCN 67-18]